MHLKQCHPQSKFLLHFKKVEGELNALKALPEVAGALTAQPSVSELTAEPTPETQTEQEPLQTQDEVPAPTITETTPEPEPTPTE